MQASYEDSTYQLFFCLKNLLKHNIFEKGFHETFSDTKKKCENKNLSWFLLI